MASTPTGSPKAPDPAPHDDDTDPSVRPWGHYVVLDDRPTAKVKRIVVDPGERLSLQLHHHRSEHWFVTQGEATVTVGDTEHVLEPGQALDIPLATPHRVRNSGDEPLVFIEVQLGEYLGEDDIVRLEDDYGRTG